LTGRVDGIELSEPFLLSFAIIMEIPMLMIVLSIIIKNKVNRIVNVIVGVLMIIIQIGSLTTGTNSLHYIFFSIIEISTLLLIIYIAWKRTNLRKFNKNLT